MGESGAEPWTEGEVIGRQTAFARMQGELAGKRREIPAWERRSRLVKLSRACLPLAILGVLSTACAVGPRYHRPSAPVPAGYKEKAAADAAPARLDTAPPSGDWKAAQPKDDVLREKWWEFFGDPDLDALEEQVAVSNQNLAQAEAQFRAARASLRLARAGLFPTLDANASVTRSRSSENRSSTPATVSRGPTTDYGFSLDLSYEADVWGRVRRTIEASVASAQASAADLETIRLSIHAELAADYFQLRGLDAQKRLLDSTVAAYEKALQLTTNRHDQGVVSGADVAQAQTQLEAARAQATDLGLSRAQLEHAIANLVGRTPEGFAISPVPTTRNTPATPSTQTTLDIPTAPNVPTNQNATTDPNATIVRNVPTAPNVPTDPDAPTDQNAPTDPNATATPNAPATLTLPAIPVALPSELLERRPDVAAAERRVASANAQIGVAKAAFFPRLLLAASGGFESSKLASWFSLPSRFWAVGPALAETLFDGGKRRAASEQAQAAYEAAVAAYREQVLTTFQEVEDNLAALRILGDEAGQQNDAVTAAERSLKMANDRYRAGITSYLEVVTAQNAALLNERTAVEIQTRRMTASVLLVKALGGGWDDSALPAAGAMTSRRPTGLP